MPLTYLLYRCPRCGHDPLEGEKDWARCPDCRVRFSRGGKGGLVRVEESQGAAWEIPGHRLVAAMEALQEWEGDGASVPEEGLIRTAAVEVRQSGEEAPVRWGPELLGFAEAMGDSRPGFIRLTEDSLSLRPSEGPEPREKVSDGALWGDWPLLEIRAVQTSSSSLQFSPAGGGLVELRFPADSPFRWESLLREALRGAYRRAGLGEILEFQPRIVTR